MSVYKRLFARSMASGDLYQDHVYGNRKKDLFQALHGSVLEIGAGTGVNLPFLPKDIHWTGIEPNPFMHRFVHEKAQMLDLNIDLQIGRAERLAFQDFQFDCVLSTLVLCSVSELEQTLSEIRRVLKPQGHFVFIEHVAAPKGSFLRGVQKTIKPAWKLVADGCRPDRELDNHINTAGFSDVHITSFNLDSPLSLIRPHIMGWGIK